MKRYQIILPLILLAFFLRVWQLPHLPPGLWYDEAYYAMDATWLLDGGPWRLFFAGNNGREPMFIYLQSLFIWIFGAQPFTSRLIGPLAGTLTVALIYVLARRLGRETGIIGAGNAPYLKKWLPYVATAGLAVSFWHVDLSRSGFRAILLPLFATFVFYAFWRGWRDNSFKWLALAGLALGFSQYTYLAARILPLVFGLFALIWTALNWHDRARLKTLWLGLVLMGFISMIIFAPLGWIFYQNPAFFSSRTGDVFFNPHSAADVFQQLSDAVRLFIDSGDPGWRHNLQGRPMVGWLGWLGFWPGLVICLRRPRHAPYLFLLVALLTLFLPALVSVPAVHALRLSSLLPIYYIIFALGLTTLAYKVFNVKRSTLNVKRGIATILVLVMLVETGLTIFDYFYRWANAADTYIAFNGPLVDFVNEVVDQTGQTAVAIPFQLYVHPTARYLLHDYFAEQPAPADLAGPVRLVTLPNEFAMLNVGNIPNSPAWVWLTRRTDGRGAAYVSRPPRPAEQAYLAGPVAAITPEIYHDRLGRELAHLRSLADPSPLLPVFTDITPQRTIRLNWANLAELTGYDVLPAVVAPGQPLTLNLYWRGLTDTTFDYRLFLQLIDSAGNPINQREADAFREDMYRWRPDGILPSQYILNIGADTPPGPYLVRLGFFDSKTGQRLTLKGENIPSSETTIDQIQLGLFYVSANGVDPRIPATPLSATFADTIKLIGVTVSLPPDLQPPTPLPVTFHWQTLHPTNKPYTVFLQLLNEQSQPVSGWDSQPFNGLYPTNLWSPGEIIADTFALPLPEAGLPPGRYHLITGFYDVVSGQRLPVDSGGNFAQLAEFEVE